MPHPRVSGDSKPLIYESSLKHAIPKALVLTHIIPKALEFCRNYAESFGLSSVI